VTVKDFINLPKGTKLHLKKGYTDMCEDTFEAGMYVRTDCYDVQKLVDGKVVGDRLTVLNDDMCRFEVV